MSLRERIEELRRFTAQKAVTRDIQLDGKRTPLYLDRSEVLSALDEPWTSERPTDGTWFVAIHSGQRSSVAWDATKVLECRVAGILVEIESRTGSRICTKRFHIRDEFLAGALWQPRTTPQDPFADKRGDG